MKLSDRDIAVRMLALDEADNDTEEEITLWLEHYETHFDKCGSVPHDGDCGIAEVKGPWTCNRCVYEEAMARAKVARELFGIEEPDA